MARTESNLTRHPKVAAQGAGPYDGGSACKSRRGCKPQRMPRLLVALRRCRCLPVSRLACALGCPCNSTSTALPLPGNMCCYVAQPFVHPPSHFRPPTPCAVPRPAPLLRPFFLAITTFFPLAAAAVSLPRRSATIRWWWTSC